MYLYSTKYLTDDRNLIYPIENLKKKKGELSVLEQIVKDNVGIKVRKIIEKNGYVVILDSLGDVYSLGTNFAGQLGVGDNLGRKKLTKIMGLKRVMNIYGGDNFVIAINKEGEYYVWGWNEFGQLGLGDFNNRNKPVKIEGLNDVIPRKICCGNNYVLLLDKKGCLYVWGGNDNHQLGLSSKNLKINTPIKYPIQYRIIDIAADYKSSYLLTDSYKVLSFGDNSFGQLGTGDFIDKIIPVKVTSLENKRIKSIFASNFSFFATDFDDKVYACGSNANGKLGLGDLKNKTIPLEILHLRNKRISQIISGDLFSIAYSNLLNQCFITSNTIFTDFHAQVNLELYF